MFASKDIFLKSSGGYQISRSVRLRSSASAYLNRTPATAGDRKTWTYSCWVKRGKLGADQALISAYTGTATINTQCSFMADDTLDFYDNNGSYVFRLTTTQVFRDPAAWYHIVLAVDTTQATSSNRVKIYVNGTQITSFSTATYPPLNDATGDWNSNTEQRIGRHATNYLDGYLAEINNIDGQALTPSSFGETNAVTGVWQPKKYTGTYGTNGFYLNFSDNSGVTATTIGKDYSGNGNNWTPNNISITAGATYDSMLDVPTPYDDGDKGRGNYATLNPLYKGSNVTPTEGNLKFGMTAGNFHEGITSTIFPTSGKWYAEFRWNAVTANTTATAVCRNNAPMVTGPCAFQNTVDTNSPTYRSYVVNGNKDTNTTSAAYGSTYTANDTIGVALDLDNGKVWFSKNGAWQASGDPAAGTNAAFTDITGSDGWTFGISGYGSGGDNCHANFGQRPFTYTPPTGFKALNTQNLPTPTIGATSTTQAGKYFNTVLYTGANPNAAKSVTGVGFQPDFTWIKSRITGYGHALFDSVRGATQRLQTNTTGAEATSATYLSSFDTDGFSLGVDYGQNAPNEPYVSWNWNAGGNTVTNTNGTISAQVRANPTAGFSVVTWTGTGAVGTVGHGLGVAPSFVIVKYRTGTAPNIAGWGCYHSSLTSAAYRIDLNSTSAQISDVNAWNSTAPTSSVVTIGTNLSVASTTMVAYCFAAVAGYSAFGKYTGNGSADGPFVFCGFRPRWVMIKRTDAVEQWRIFDTGRDVNLQPLGNELYPNLSNAEASVTAMDFLSNGFKQRQAVAGLNASGGTYIYAAFAENPFKHSLAR